MNVVTIGEYRAKDTIAVLTFLLHQAKNGELSDIALCAMKPNGNEDIMFTGAYRRRPSNASNAATRMFWRAMQLQDDQELAGEGTGG